MTEDPRLALGREGEARAARLLEELGYRVVASRIGGQDRGHPAGSSPLSGGLAIAVFMPIRLPQPVTVVDTAAGHPGS